MSWQYQQHVFLQQLRQNSRGKLSFVNEKPHNFAVDMAVIERCCSSLLAATTCNNSLLFRQRQNNASNMQTFTVDVPKIRNETLFLLLQYNLIRATIVVYLAVQMKNIWQPARSIVGLGIFAYQGYNKMFYFSIFYMNHLIKQVPTYVHN